MSETLTRNSDLLRAVARQIREHPETYNQHVWACGTQACIAGWAVLLSGGRIGSANDTWGESVLDHAFLDDDEVGEHVGDAAERLLGLTADEATVLFAGFWEPLAELTVPEALEKIADGADIFAISGHGPVDYEPEVEF